MVCQLLPPSALIRTTQGDGPLSVRPPVSPRTKIRVPSEATLRARLEPVDLGTQESTTCQLLPWSTLRKTVQAPAYLLPRVPAANRPPLGPGTKVTLIPSTML